MLGCSSILIYPSVPCHLPLKLNVCIDLTNRLPGNILQIERINYSKNDRNWPIIDWLSLPQNSRCKTIPLSFYVICVGSHSIQLEMPGARFAFWNSAPVINICNKCAKILHGCFPGFFTSHETPTGVFSRHWQFATYATRMGVGEQFFISGWRLLGKTLRSATATRRKMNSN